MVNFNNNVTHIYSVEMHVGMVNMQTLLPWTCQMLFDSYDRHVSSQSLYTSQIGDKTFH